MGTQQDQKYATTALENVFQALHHQNITAIDYIPQMLEILCQFPELHPRFQELVSGIPVWVFLRWTAQLLSNLAHHESAALVLPVIEQLARTYPQAVYYPFQLTKEDLLHNSSARSSLTRIQFALETVGVQQLDTFVQAMEQVCHPIFKLKDIASFASQMVDGAQSILRMSTLLKDFELQCLSQSRLHLGTHVGEQQVKFRQWAHANFVAKFGAEACKVHSMKLADIKSELKAILDSTKCADWLSFTGVQELQRLSPLLSRFEILAEKFPTKVIEIPGQYDGQKCPEPHLHVLIVELGDRVSVMNSIRKPKALTLFGNDQKEYKFLVKFGEDMRLDQRIETLLGVMDQILVVDTLCAQKALRLVQYRVVPFNKRLGVVSWLRDSTTLKSLIGNHVFDQAYHEWYAKVVHLTGLDPADMGRDFPKHWFVHEVNNIPPTDLRLPRLMQQQIESISANHLCQAIQRHCASTEAFLTVRKKFVSSFSALNIALHVLGVGDRHLDNWIYMKGSGEVAAIDFGAAFGQVPA